MAGEAKPGSQDSTRNLFLCDAATTGKHHGTQGFGARSEAKLQEELPLLSITRADAIRQLIAVGLQAEQKRLNYGD